ncbi:MAG: hypothetical protein PHE25_03335 [Candidatus Gracilibacteria bacterium]|nr:hypothetical protein [Candidatus Gracilibacteria bacterium]
MTEIEPGVSERSPEEIHEALQQELYNYLARPFGSTESIDAKNKFLEKFKSTGKNGLNLTCSEKDAYITYFSKNRSNFADENTKLGNIKSSLIEAYAGMCNILRETPQNNDFIVSCKIDNDKNTRTTQKIQKIGNGQYEVYLKIDKPRGRGIIWDPPEIVKFKLVVLGNKIQTYNDEANIGEQQANIVGNIATIHTITPGGKKSLEINFAFPGKPFGWHNKNKRY